MTLGLRLMFRPQFFCFPHKGMDQFENKHPNILIIFVQVICLDNLNARGIFHGGHAHASGDPEVTFLAFAHIVFVALQLDLRVAVGSDAEALVLQLGQFLHGGVYECIHIDDAALEGRSHPLRLIRDVVPELILEHRIVSIRQNGLGVAVRVVYEE